MKNFSEYEKIINVDISRLKPHPDNEKLLPRLTKGELRRLKERIEKYGFNEPIEITKTGYVLDGNNRIFKILMPFEDELQIKKVPARVINIKEELESDYIISKNFDRRQLSKLMQSYIRGQQYNDLKKQGERKDLTCGQNVHKLKSKNSTCGQNVHKLKTSEILADKFGMTERTIRRDGSFAKLCDELIRNTDYDFVFNLLNGEIKANKSLITKLSKQSKEFINKIYQHYKTENDFQPLKEVFEKFSKNKNKNKKKLVFEFEIDEDLKKEVEKLSKETGMNKNELMTQLLKKALKDFNKT